MLEEIVQLCGYCGRATDELRAVEVVFRKIVRAQHIRRQAYFNIKKECFERGVLSGDCCKYCSQWIALVASGVRTNLTNSKVWKLTWPSYTCRGLLGPCASHVWKCLPQTLRHEWRFLVVRLINVEDVSESVALVLNDNQRKVHEMNVFEFQRLADFDFDTKCAICRASFPADETQLLPFCKFRECHWNAKAIRRMHLQNQSLDLLQQRPRLAPLWHVPLPYALGYMIWTRIEVDEEQGLCFAICSMCRLRPSKEHFFSVSWPGEAMFNTENVRDQHYGGMQFMSGETSWNVPTQRDLFFLSPVRLFDLAVSGVRVCKRDDGVGNVQYQTLAITGDTRGVSTQFVSFFPNPLISWAQVKADIDQVVLWEEILLCSRSDLIDWFKKRRSRDRALVPSPLAVRLASELRFSSIEASIVLAIPRRAHPLASDDIPRRLILATGPPNWVHPRVLPRSPKQAFTTALHVILTNYKLRTMILQCKGVPHVEAIGKLLCGILGGGTPNLDIFRQILTMLVCRSSSFVVRIEDFVSIMVHLLRQFDDSLSSFQDVAHELSHVSRVETCLRQCESNNLHSHFGLFWLYYASSPNSNKFLIKELMSEKYVLRTIVLLDNGIWKCFSRGRNIEGDVMWYECKGSGVLERTQEWTIELLNSSVAHLFYSTEDPDGIFDGVEGQDCLEEECMSLNTASSVLSASDEDNNFSNEEIADVNLQDHGDEEKGSDIDVEEMFPPVDSFIPETVEHAPSVPEYFQGPGSNTCGLHILLHTLQACRRNNGQSSKWCRRLVCSVTSRFPEIPNVSQYLEAYLFVPHFPIRVDGHFPGCMPLCLYSKDMHDTRVNPYVSFSRYVVDVLRDPHSSRAHDTSWCAFSFNVLLHQAIEREGSPTLVQRGMGTYLQKPQSQGEYAQRYGDCMHAGFLYDEQHAKRSVESVCGALKKYGVPTYFVTWTCDQRRFPGIAKVYNFILKNNLNVEYFAVHFQRLWDRVNTLFLRYLYEDPNKPIGELQHHFLRKEFQPDVGNFYHCHLLAWTLDKVNDCDKCVREAAFMDALNRITASTQGAFHGLIPECETRSWELRAHEAQTHRCQSKCMIPDEVGELKCRWGAPWFRHSDAYFQPMGVAIPHELEAMLIDAGVAEIQNGRCVVTEMFQGGAWLPPRGFDDGRISAFTPRLFLATRGCHMNNQVIFGPRWVLAYLVKYVAGAEERRLARFKQSGQDSMRVETLDLRERKRSRTHGTKHGKFHGTMISMCEIIFHCLELQTIECDWFAVNVNMGAPEQRFVTLRPQWPIRRTETPLFQSREAMLDSVCAGFENLLPSRCGRVRHGGHRYPLREPTIQQWRTYVEWRTSRFSCDRVMMYCMRPPELFDLCLAEFFELCILTTSSITSKWNKMSRLELQAFVRNWQTNGLLDMRMHACFLTREIFKPRYAGVRHALFVNRLGVSLHDMTRIVLAGNDGAFAFPWLENIVDPHAKLQVLVSPRYFPHSVNWISWRLLTTTKPFGHEEEVLEVAFHEYGVQTLKDLARELRSAFSIRDFVFQQLVFWPIGFRALFRQVRSFAEMFNTELYAETSIMLPLGDEEMDEVRQKRWDDFIQDKVARHRTMFNYLPPFVRTIEQTQASWDEQQRVFNFLVQKLRLILYPNKEGCLSPSPVLIEGPPGSAKSFLVLNVLREMSNMIENSPSCSQVLWDVSALAAHRAVLLGGTHVHALFGFVPPKSFFYVTPGLLYHSAMKHLQRRPEKKRFLQEIKVLVLDEFCQIGGQTLLAIDMVLREVRRSKSVFGGIWLLACGDHFQNEPIGEIPPLMSWFVRHHFSVIQVRELYRARGDAKLRAIIEHMRVPRLNEETIQGVLETIEQNCVLANDITVVSNDTVWLLATNAAVIDARNSWFAHAVARKSQYLSEDFVMRQAAWIRTRDNQAEKHLSRLCPLPAVCLVVVGAQVKVSMNGWYSGKLIPNGALGIVLDFDDRSISIDIRSPISLGAIQIPRVYSPTVFLASVQYRRYQFPVELYVASTIHDMQGSTLFSLTTFGDGSPGHLMWSRMMLFTLLSRVEKLRSITIVHYDRNVFRLLLSHVTSWHQEADVWLKLANVCPPLREGVVPILEALPRSAFTESMGRQLPPDNQFIVYVIQSIQTREVYIGFTNNFLQRLSVHNSGGCRTTQHTRDWVLRAYVFGFPDEVLVVRSFETIAQHFRRPRMELTDTIYVLYSTIALFRSRGTEGAERLQVHLVSS